MSDGKQKQAIIETRFFDYQVNGTSHAINLINKNIVEQKQLINPITL